MAVTANLIKLTRKRLGESHRKFAKRFGVTRTTILNWEHGRLPEYEPTLAHIERVIGELGWVYAERQRQIAK